MSINKDCRAISIEWLNTWVKIGKKNFWIGNVGSGNLEVECAFEDTFSADYIHICSSPDELFEKFRFGNWCLGQGLALGDLCFINQIDGGDEWLTIKQDLAFESISWLAVMEYDNHEELLNRLQKATLDQCRKLRY